MLPLLLLAGCLSTADTPPEEPQPAEKRRIFCAPDGTVTVRWADKILWRYNPDSPEGKPSFHPLSLPGSDHSLTWNRPEDHPWHLGLWFSWKFINGVNFWEPDPRAAIRVETSQIKMQPDFGLIAETSLLYLADDRPLVREQRLIRVDTRADGSYAITWDATFTALENVVFDRTPPKRDKQDRWSSGGYAGLTLRLGPAFTYEIGDTAGHVDRAICGESSSGLTVAVRPRPPGPPAARLTFTTDPPAPWFVRHDPAALGGRGYHLLGPAPLFHQALTLPAGESRRFAGTLDVAPAP